jgi:hypothetical protein
MANASCSAIFDLPEILECILLFLKLRDLLQVQLVCRRWKDWISTSPKIQERLFLRSVLAKENVRTEINPLLQTIFPNFFVFTDCRDTYEFVNRLSDLAWVEDEEQRSRILRLDASWRRMYPIQPPAKIRELVVYSYDVCIYDLEINTNRLENELDGSQPNGVTMGFLFDLIRHLVDMQPHGSFWIRWHMFPILEEVDDDQVQSDQDSPGGTNTKLENSISVYHHHWNPGCGGDITPSGLEIESLPPDIISLIDERHGIDDTVLKSLEEKKGERVERGRE